MGPLPARAFLKEPRYHSGHFEIKGLPPGVYTISAVHEQLGEQSATLTVLPQKTSSATFTFTMKK